jgi:4a-hydroxytetrahydrobiopterin dehydratase|tara:strand:- start:1586 stop:1990 length:405 start_codon:yes stop_codon:yes gene_type:complete
MASASAALALCSVDGCSTTPILAPGALRAQLGALPAWTLNAEGTHISRAFVAKNFKEAMAFLNRAGDVAEEAGHHPDFHLTSWRNVEVVLYTHEVGGLTKNDLVLAARIDECLVTYSPKWKRAQIAAGVALPGA